MEYIQDILAALGVVLDAITAAIFAMSFGFQMVPTAFAYVVGAGGALAYGSVLPISLQAETIAVTGTVGRNIRERLSMVLFAGIIMVVLGGFGILQAVIDFAGPNVVNGMMAGVGIIMTKIAIGMVKENRFTGVVSMITGLVIYLLTQNLIYLIVGNVVLTSVISYFKNGPVELGEKQEKYKFGIRKPMVNATIIRGTLALVCLTMGANIAFGNISADMAGAEANIDGLTVYSGLADTVSALFGGAPVEAVISPTAAAPHPLLSGLILMILMAVILATGVLPKIARFVPVQSIAGFLFVLGAIFTLPVNTFLAFNGADTVGVLSGGMALAVTAISDPFIGLVAGVIIKLIAGPLGLVF